nr:PREDICTED: GATA-type zinc finger protein 1 [Anolis carolinensis]|eukprot:XP_008101294.1 PREDICTED: GATA-type zinc finger protein 1 [Anolis carolinensis]
MAEGQLFVEGQPPDFSLLQELLCPPCLEPDPSLFPEAACSRESRFTPCMDMACCLQMPETKAWDFLQEAGQGLSQPEPSNSSRRLCQRYVGHPWHNSHCAAGSHVECCFPEAALASFSPLDALSLISLHCSSLEIDSTEDKNPMCLASAHMEEPQTGVDIFSRPEPPRGGIRRVSRKQPRPQRSCEPLDRTFQGITFQMQLQDCPSSKEGCRLCISPRYSSEKLRKRRVPLVKEGQAGSSEEEEGCLSTHRNKRCASCKTKKTPLWRDAEDGTPLCNACGIRYKKYRIRCLQCWNIPKHCGKRNSHCSSCGGRLHVVAAQSKSGKRCAVF